MKTFKAKSLILAVCVLHLCGAELYPLQTGSTDQHIAADIDAYMTRATSSGLFTGSVLLAHNGKVIIAKGYGMASLQFSVPNTPQTKFDIASVSKTFTATLTLLLEERGKLNVHDPICKYLSDCPAEWKEVTIHHLLTHTSGITNYTELPDQYERRALASFMPDAMNRIRKMPLQFKPGERFNYSNTGYKLLERIIEAVTGKQFEACLQEMVLGPLKMTTTGALEQSGIRRPIVKNLASGYTDGVGPLEDAPFVHPAYGGGLYSTVEDLKVWGQSFFTEKLLSKKNLDAALTPGQGNYGYGWFVFNKVKHRFIMHGGNIPGFGVTFALYPDDSLVVVIASNLDTAPTNRIHDDLVKIFFGEKYEPLPVWATANVDPKIYDQYIGRYQKTDDPKFVITITKENGQLWNRLGDDPGAATMVLRPLSETRFYNKMFVLYEATFLLDQNGKPTALIADGPWGRSEFKKIL